MAEKEIVVGLTRYPANPLTAIENGALMDLRLKLAIEFLKGGPSGSGAKDAACAALDLASELVALAEERGLIDALPEHGELTAALKRHVERNVRAALYQNTAGARVQREEGPIITGGMPMGMHG